MKTPSYHEMYHETYSPNRLYTFHSFVYWNVYHKFDLDCNWSVKCTDSMIDQYHSYVYEYSLNFYSHPVYILSHWIYDLLLDRIHLDNDLSTDRIFARIGKVHYPNRWFVSLRISIILEKMRYLSNKLRITLNDLKWCWTIIFKIHQQCQRLRYIGILSTLFRTFSCIENFIPNKWTLNYQYPEINYDIFHHKQSKVLFFYFSKILWRKEKKHSQQGNLLFFAILTNANIQVNFTRIQADAY